MVTAGENRDMDGSKRLDLEVDFKTRLLRILLIACIPFALYYSIHALQLGNLFNAALNFFISLVLIIGLVKTFQKAPSERQARLIGGFAYTFLIALTILHINVIRSGRVDHYFWFVLFPIIAFIVIGFRQGLLTVAVYTGVILACFWTTDKPDVLQISYTDFMIKTAICIVVAALISAIYAKVREQAHRALIDKQVQLTRSEQALETLAKSLEEEVRQRTAQLLEANEALKKEVKIREASEEALRASEDKYRGLVQHAPAGIYEFDMEKMKFISVNDVMCEYTGYSESEFLELSPFDLLSDESKNTLNGLVEEVFTKRPKELLTEYKIKGKNQREFWVLANARFFYENGVPKRAMAVVHDLTDRHRAEEERRRLETQLQNAKKLEALGTLAGGVAHDLNNILGGVVSYPDLLLHDLDPNSPLRGPLLTIKKSGERAAEIVQDLLTLARQRVENRAVINLNDVVSEFVASTEYKRILETHPGVKVETSMEKHVLNTTGSEVHISKTLMNLMANAADALPAGGSVTLCTKNCYLDNATIGFETIPEGEYTVLEVSDNGIGISESDLEHIFEPFYTKKKMGRSGTGLGMSVVWGTMKDHNGFVDVHSEEGLGTTVSLYFPVTRKDETISKSTYIEDYLSKGESILVIDDSREQRELASRMLMRIGYTIDCVESGEEAVKVLQKRTYDLLLLDMVMDPGMNGLQTYQTILRIVPNQKAIIVSGFTETEMVKEAQRLGAGAYVKKPYTLEKIGRAVRAELDRQD